jgi:hypothetical protein
MGPLATVKQELLVRYLYAWAPAALHHARRVTYVDGSPDPAAPVAALGVFTELADVLVGHRLTVLLAGVPPGDVVGSGGLPDGLTVRAPNGGLLADLRADRALGAPILAYLDSGGGPVAPPGMEPSQPAAAPPADLLGALGGTCTGETLVALGPQADPEQFRGTLLAAGFRFAVVVELVESAGAAQRLFFATSAVRNLERFKDALWAVDEYAGVRYRDPRSSDHPPLDISLQPHVGPLRRALTARLAVNGPDTVAQLREYALSNTLYRAADVNRALQPLLAAGQVIREPERGRLTPQTLIKLPTRR